MNKPVTMAMNTKKRSSIIREANAEQYFALLNMERELSRQERFMVKNRGRELRMQAKENKELRNKWNQAAKNSGYAGQMFKVSEG